MTISLQLSQAACRAAKSSARHAIKLPRALAAQQPISNNAIVARQCAISHLQSSYSRSYATTIGATTTEATKKPRKPRAPKVKTEDGEALKPKRKAVKRKAKKVVKKKAKKATKAKPRRRRVLTEKQKEAAVLKKQREHVRELRTTALLGQEPKPKPAAAYIVYIAQHLSNNSDAKSALKESAANFKVIAPRELETLNHTANQNRAENQAAYSSWVQSHSPDIIRSANNARRALARLSKTTGKTVRGTRLIKDDRQVKRPLSAYFHFSTQKSLSGDLHGMSISDRARVVKEDWNALSASGKKEFEEMAAQDRARYARDFKSAYGRESSVASSS